MTSKLGTLMTDLKLDLLTLQNSQLLLVLKSSPGSRTQRGRSGRSQATVVDEWPRASRDGRRLHLAHRRRCRPVQHRSSDHAAPARPTDAMTQRNPTVEAAP